MPNLLQLVLPGTLIVLTPELRLDPQDHDRDHIHPDATVDSSFAGEIRLTLTKPTRIKKLTVDLVGRQEILINGVFHAYETLGRHLKLKVGDEILPEGEHMFAFEFIVPANTAPYGKCQHGSTIYKLLATATPAGLFEQPLTAEQKLGIHTNPSKTRNEAPTFSATSKSNNQHLGAVGLQLTSQYLLVAGYLNLALSLSAVKEAVRIEDVRVDLLQNWTLQSVHEPDKIQTIPEERFRIWSLRDGAATAVRTASPSRFLGATVQPGDSWSIERRFPLTDDERICASTLPSSKTGLKVTHRLAVTLSYSLIDENIGTSGSSSSRMEKMYLETPAILNVCSCVLEALQLPYYVQDIKDDVARLGFPGCDARNDCLYG